MGAQDIKPTDGSTGRHSMRLVLRDLDALEEMLASGAFETDIRRIGAEQELVLVNEAYQPSPVSLEVLDKVTDPRVVPEIARFNMEMNCEPVVLAGSCFTSLERQLIELYDIVASAAATQGAMPLLSGICPTVELSDLGRTNMVPRPRYERLDDMLKQMRGTDFELRIEGADDLHVIHPTVMLESVNTSFQVHYQVTPAEFAEVYNVAMAVAAPVLAAAVNSPVLFGKRLWRETRIAIFQQVVDTRGAGAGRRDFLGRVRFGEKWVDSVLDIFRADVARFRQIVAANNDAAVDPFEDIEAGRAPKLAALQTFNSCVYRWMRPCYGITDGKPHLRIENRALPAGPTIEDEVANSAFWIGLVSAGPSEWPDLTERLDFKEARANFMKAAREGLSCHFTWIDGVEVPARELIPDILIPIARKGLERQGVAASDIDRTLSIIEKRVSTRQTGSHWTLSSIAKMHGRGTRAERLAYLTRCMIEHQRSGDPVHDWPIRDFTDDEGSISSAYSTVSQCMTTDLFTVQEDECIDLVASIMDWERLRHVPVEDGNRKLVGLVSYRSLIRSLVKRRADEYEHPIAVQAIMVPDPITTTPDTPTLEAIKKMRDRQISCLPVVEDGRLVGIISERDYTRIAVRLLEDSLRRGQHPCP